MEPKAPQGPRLPILSGGESDAALRGVAEVCDGWHPLNVAPDQGAEGLDRLRGFVAGAGRSMADLWLIVRPGRNIPLTSDLARRYGALGVRMLVADVEYRSSTLPEALAHIARLAKTLRLSQVAVS